MAAHDETAHDRPQDDPQVVCAQCSKEMPADLAIHPEGQEYALYFCTPECHAEWRKEKADRVEREHRGHSGTDQGR